MSRSKETIQSVIVGSSLAALTGATTSATIAVLKNAPAKQWAISTGLNCGIFGATFFLVRETFITYQRQKNVQFGLKDSQTKDFDAMFSSMMAGATTGGLLSAAYRGPKTVVSGAFMFGTICSALQLVYTTGQHWRQETILKSGQLDGPSLSPNTNDEKSDSSSGSFLKHIHMPSWFPIHKLSEQEYNDLLDTKLNTLEAELAELEEKLRDKNK